MNVFFKLPVSASNSIGTLDAGDVYDAANFFPTIEEGAWGHWTLSTDLIDSTSNKLLSPTAQTDYIFENNTLKLSSISQAVRKGFNTGFRGVGTTGFTVCVVAKQSGLVNGFAAIAGNQQDSRTGSLLVYSNQVAGYATGLNFTNAPNAQLDTTKWFFAAASYSNDENVVRRMVVESGDYSFTNEFTGIGRITDPAQSNAFNSVCLGVTQVSNATDTVDLDFGEFIVFNSALSVADMKNLAFKSKKRMKNKGIII